MSTSDNTSHFMAQSKIIAPPARLLPQQRKHTGLSSVHEVVFVFVLCLAQFLSLAAMNQTVAPMLILAKYFDIHDYGNLSWFSAAYSMTVGTFILPAGRLGDIHGHKLVLMIGWAWFSLWSLVSGFCGPSNLIWFSTCRAFQGMGPALVIPNAIAIIGRTFPIGLKRNIAFAYFGASGPTGAAVGAILASLVAENLSWHWCFWFLAMTCAMLVAVSWFVIPWPSESPASPERATIKPESEQIPAKPTFDHLGALTGVTGLILINFALNQAPLVGWMTPYIPALLLLGLLSLLAFVWVELCFAQQPIVPLRGLQCHAAFVLAIVFTGWSSHGIWVYYLYIFLEHLRGHSALLTSLETSPVALTGIFFAFLTVYLLRRGVAVSLIMLISCFFFFLGSLLVVLTPLHQTYWANTFFAILLMPGAMNLSFPAATILLSEQLPREKQGMAASLVATVVNYSISCGLGLAGSIHKRALLRAGDRAGVERSKGNGRKPVPALSESSEVLVGVRLEGMRMAVWFGVGLGALGVLVAGGFWLRSGLDSSSSLRIPAEPLLVWPSRFLQGLGDRYRQFRENPRRRRRRREGGKEQQREQQQRGQMQMELGRQNLERGLARRGGKGGNQSWKGWAGTTATTATTGTTGSEDSGVVEGETGLRIYEEIKSVFYSAYVGLERTSRVG